MKTLSVEKRNKIEASLLLGKVKYGDLRNIPLTATTSKSHFIDCGLDEEIARRLEMLVLTMPYPTPEGVMALLD